MSQQPHGQELLLQRLRQEIPPEQDLQGKQTLQGQKSLQEKLAALHQQQLQQQQMTQSPHQQMTQSPHQQITQSQQQQTTQSPQQQITQSQQQQITQSPQQQSAQSRQGLPQQGQMLQQPFTPLTEITPMTPATNPASLLGHFRHNMASELADIEQQAFQKERRRQLELDHLEWLQEQFYQEEQRQRQLQIQQELRSRANTGQLLQGLPVRPEPKVQIQPPPQQPQLPPGMTAQMCLGSSPHLHILMLTHANPCVCMRGQGNRCQRISIL